MKGLLVLLSTVALASCSPILDELLGGGGEDGDITDGALGKTSELGEGAADGDGAPPSVLGAVSEIVEAKVDFDKKVLSSVAGGGGDSSGLGGPAGGIPGGAGPGDKTDRGYQGLGGVYPQAAGGGLFVALKFLAQGLADIGGNTRVILDDVIHLRVPAMLDDGFNAIISAARALGGIIDALIPGLGTFLGNLVVSIAKILMCLLGSPGLTGSLFGGTPGQDNTRDIPYICTPDYGRNWGCSYNGKYDHANSIIKYYKVQNARQQAQQFINKYTNGRGVDSLSGSRKIVLTSILAISTIMDKGSDNWTDDDIIDIIVNILIIHGALGDSYEHGLGTKIVDQWIAVLKKYNKNKRFPDMSKYRTKIIDCLKDANEDEWAGAFNHKKSRDSNQSSGKSNTSSNGHDINDNEERTSYNRNSNKDSKSDGSYDDSTEDLRKRDASSEYKKGSEEFDKTSSSLASGKSVVYPDGSSFQEYKHGENEGRSGKKSFESGDTRSSELSYKKTKHDEDC